MVDLTEEQHEEEDHVDAGATELHVEESHVDADATEQPQPQATAAVGTTTSLEDLQKAWV